MLLWRDRGLIAAGLSFRVSTRPRRPAVRTRPSQGREPGSIPGGAAARAIRGAAAPFAVGDWVAAAVGRCPLIGVVRDIYPDPCDPGSWCMDVVAHDRRGRRVGRRSPPCGGPTTHEPALDCADFEAIAPPDFPLEPDIAGDWRRALKPAGMGGIGRT